MDAFSDSPTPLELHFPLLIVMGTHQCRKDCQSRGEQSGTKSCPPDLLHQEVDQILLYGVERVA
jgi:hypothetical protein